MEMRQNIISKFSTYFKYYGRSTCTQTRWQATSAKVYITWKCLPELEMLIQASQGASSKKVRDSKWFFFCSFRHLKKVKSSCTTYVHYLFFPFVTFFTLFGINWNYKNLKKRVQGIMSNEKVSK